MPVTVVSPLNLQRPFVVALVLTCILLCAASAIVLSSLWVFAPLFVAALLYSIFRWPVAVIAGVLFLAPFLPLPLQGLKALGFSWGEAASAAKELGLLGAGAVLAWRQGFKLEKLDLVLFGLLVWAVVVTLIHPTSSAAIGLKDDFDFVIPFLVGRVILLSPRWIKTGLWVAGLIAILGVIEFFALGIGPRMLLMGVQNPNELTTTFKADFFEGFRAGSTLGGPLEFGGFCAVVLLVFASFYRGLPRGYFFLASLIAMGLVASVTRMAGLGLALGLIFLAVRTGQKLRLAAFAVGSAILLLAVIVPVMGLGGFFAATVSGEDSSIGSHRTSLQEKSAYVLSHPLGTGAGSVGQRAIARDPNATIVESSYLQFGMEYGWLGFSLLVLFCGALFFKFLQTHSNFGLASCAVTIAILTMYAFSSIHMEFGLNSWTWVIIGSGFRQYPLNSAGSVIMVAHK